MDRLGSASDVGIFIELGTAIGGVNHGRLVLEGWRAAITVGTNDGPLTGLSNR